MFFFLGQEQRWGPRAAMRLRWRPSSTLIDFRYYEGPMTASEPEEPLRDTTPGNSIRGITSEWRRAIESLPHHSPPPPPPTTTTNIPSSLAEWNLSNRRATSDTDLTPNRSRGKETVAQGSDWRDPFLAIVWKKKKTIAEFVRVSNWRKKRIALVSPR